MKQQEAIDLADDLVRNYTLREVMVIVRPEDPDEWEVMADFADGGGELMESKQALDRLRTAQVRNDHEASFDSRYFRVR